MGMHKAVARDILRKAGWSEAHITMALRIMAYDGARAPAQIAGVVRAFAERSEDAAEQKAWRGVADRLDHDPSQADALWALRGF